MKTVTLVFTLLLGFCCVSPLWAHNKVVVVPLNSNNVPIRIYYGSVTSTGSLETGNAVSSIRNSVGYYTIEVGEPVQGCSLTATKGTQGTGTVHVLANATTYVLSSGTAFNVRMRDGNGANRDTDFHFTAICPK